MESEVIPGGPVSDVVFSQTRTEIESLRREDNELLVNAGEDPLAHTGEEYRQELRKGLQVHGEAVKALAWEAGSGLAGGPAKGHFFCAGSMIACSSALCRWMATNWSATPWPAYG